MADIERWSVERDAAETYESVLVPALFEEWAPRMLAAGNLRDGDHFIDVACGTGVVARHAIKRIGRRGRVVGLDRSEAMLGVARRVEPDVEWRLGDATALPFADESFDVAVCQAGLMFIQDRIRAFGEMRRVLRRGGRLAVQVWAISEGQDAFAEIVEKHAGKEAADHYRAPWSLSDPDQLIGLAHAGGFPNAELRTEPGVARFASIASFIAAETETLIHGDVDTDRLVADTAEAFAPYQAADGTLTIPEPGHVVTATRT